MSSPKAGASSPDAGRTLFGTIKLFSVTRGFGFISPEDDSMGDIYISRTVLHHPKGFATAGQRVSFKLVGRKADCVRAVDNHGLDIVLDTGVSERAQTKVQAVESRARQLTLQAAEGSIPVVPGTPLAAAQELYKRQLDSIEVDEEEESMTEEEKQETRARALRVMLEQQAAARDLAVAEQRREERRRTWEERQRALRTPTPPLPKVASMASSSGVVDVVSLQSVQDIVDGAVGSTGLDGMDAAGVDAMSAAAAMAALGETGAGGADGDAPMDGEVDMAALVSAAVAAATANIEPDSTSTTPAAGPPPGDDTCTDGAPLTISAESAIAAAAAVSALEPSTPAGSPGAPAEANPSTPNTTTTTTTTAATDQQESKDCLADLAPKPIHRTTRSVSEPAPAPPPLTPISVTAVRSDSVSEYIGSPLVDRPIPANKSAVEAEMLAVSTTMRFHEAELNRLKKRLSALNDARKKLSGADAMLTQLHLNHLLAK